MHYRFGRGSLSDHNAQTAVAASSDRARRKTPQLISYEDPSIAALLAEARQTWSIPEWQLVHISNGREFLQDPRHSDFIQQMPSAYRHAPWIEVEARQKEHAIASLQESWPPIAHKLELGAQSFQM